VTVDIRFGRIVPITSPSNQPRDNYTGSNLIRDWIARLILSFLKVTIILSMRRGVRFARIP